MKQLVQAAREASDALARNNADRLEEMCAFAIYSMQKHAIRTSDSLSHDERSAMSIAVMAFQRQVLAARANIILRERLFASHQKESAPWAP